MKSRIYTGVLLAFSLGLFLYLSSPLVLLVMFSAIMTYSLYEWLSMTNLDFKKKIYYLSLFIALLLFSFTIPLTLYSYLLTIAMSFWVLVALLIISNSHLIRVILSRLSSFVGLCLMYFAWLFLVNIGTNMSGINTGGSATTFLNNNIQIRDYLLFLVILVSLSDISGYFVGKFMGTRKLCPNISPNKTIQGFIGSIILPVIFFVIYFLIYKDYQFILTDLMFLILLCVFCTFGDLFVSCQKRTFDRKDSGNILPGHGGLLDRLDSYLPCIVLYQYWMFV